MYFVALFYPVNYRNCCILLNLALTRKTTKANWIHNSIWKHTWYRSESFESRLV